MKKIFLIISAILILTVGAASAVYAKDNNPFNKSFRRPMMMQQSNGNNRGYMMYQSNYDAYSSMIDLMRKNGFEEAAKAMENGDFGAMNDFMNNMTDEQYNQMLDIMNSNGYGNMGRMMGNFNRQQMVNMHNSMMRR